MQHPKLLLKIGNDPEFNIADKVQGLKYLGDNPTPVINNSFLDVSGVDGSQFQFTTFSRYQVPAKFLLRFNDWQDFKLAKHQFYRLFAQRKEIRMRTDVESSIVRFVYPNLPEIAPAEDGAHYSLFTMNFDNPSGYRYSLYRSNVVYDFASDSIQFGELDTGEKPNYHFATNSFKVYNPSDIAIDPYGQKHDLQVVCHFSGNSMKIANASNGSEWEYTKPANSSDTIILNGINTTLNGQPASVNTDYGNLILDTGWNDFTVTGANSIDITFSFPFIYL
ncbi:phage tail domain-containing protein [Limosilactobacillus vaginalis]|uniref:phage tail domain-containing protein n=1 Tax=Limosilactobacillus vaginalis TaxID=1633 RepID=UPI0022E982B3|nr:phage tail domain-containing protein [Limosilactobacillus vaginalis]